MIIKNILLEATRRIFSLLFQMSLQKVCILMLMILHTIKLINSPQSCPQTTPGCAVVH